MLKQQNGVMFLHLCIRKIHLLVAGDGLDSRQLRPMVSTGTDKYRFWVFFHLFSCHTRGRYSYFLQFGGFDRVLKD